MAVYEKIRTISVEAGSAVTIYRFVIQAAADGQFDHSTLNARADGVSCETVANVGDALPIALPDGARVKVEAGAAVARDAIVAADANGKAITHVSGVGNWRLGTALSASSADGEVIEIQFLRSIDEVV